MTAIEPLTRERLLWAQDLTGRIRDEIHKVLVGQDETVDQVLVALLAAGHILLEGNPGLGKTLLVRALARAVRGGSARIQFTPDLMPSDVMGHAVYDPKTESFRIRKGPVFTNLLLADEINRAPAKTQSALLEVMQEQQVTIEGRSFPAGAPFMVLATQNPLEQEGTYPLPEAQLDRFLLKVAMDFPQETEERDLVRLVTSGSSGDLLQVDSGVDYRLRQLERAPTYLDSGSPLTSQALLKRFEELAGGGATAPATLTIEGRPIRAVHTGPDMAWFEFAELCEGPRSQNDYIELARLYGTVFIANVPVFTPSHEDAARRFIMLIDEFYDRGVKTVVSAAAPPESLYRGERLRFEFQRAASRLVEMQTPGYLAGRHHA